MAQNIPKPTAREKELASLGYVWIFSIFVLVSQRKSIFVQHHARRGVVLFLLSILLWVFPILRIGEFLVLALMLNGFIAAAMGNESHMPILAELADGTLRPKHLSYYWHHTKHGVKRIGNPEHVTPEFREKLQEQHQELNEQERELKAEKELLEKEEKKLSTLYNRVNEDEKKIAELEAEIQKLKQNKA